LPEREERITTIFHSALEREGAERRAFLDGACAGDEELRREIESLIRSHEEAVSLIESPANERRAEPPEEDHGNLVGRTLGHYRIARRLGGGGMGEVFLAEDTRLGRRVAIKILPKRLTADSSLVARFRQEARAASTLNHPNIVTIYEVGEADGIHFIATEFVEGETLREHIVLKQLTITEAIDIATQVSSALSKAHQGGVVHRDVKPENIMLDGDGQAKVLDFGIAKLTEQARSITTEAPTVMKVETSPGAVMGTAHYMSPEQARGLRDVDARTDVWSVGVVLYEMLAGRQPFEGASATDVMSAILNREPAPLARFNRDVSEALELVVQKALTKDREERYQSAKDLLSDLRRVRQRLDSGTSASMVDRSEAIATERLTKSKTPDTQTRPGNASTAEPVQVHTISSAEYIVTEFKRHKRGIFMVVAAFLAAAAGVGYALYNFTRALKPGPPPIFQNATPSHVTTSGTAQDASISPDGKYIVYLEAAEDGSRSLVIRQTATGTTIPIVPPTKGNVLKHTSFSPDGNFVYYYFSDRTKRGSLYRVSSVGGTPKKVVDLCDSSAAVTPDGKKIAYMRWEGHTQSSIVLANADGTNERVIATLDGDEWFSDLGPAWSPDGKTIATVAGVTTDGVEGVRLIGIDVQTGATRELSPKRWVEAGRVVWMPDSTAFMLTAMERTDEMRLQVWRVSYPSGEANRVTNDAYGYDDSLGVTADGRTLVVVTKKVFSRIENLPAGDTSRLNRLTASEANQEGFHGFDVAPNGRIVFSSFEGGQFDLWSMNADGGGRQQLTSDKYLDGYPAVSPDGRYIVFQSNRPSGSVTAGLWRIDIDGGNPVQLAERADFPPHISPDSRWVIYSYWSPSKNIQSILRVSIEGGEPVQVTQYPSAGPSYSPDGEWVVCYYLNEQIKPSVWRYAVIPASGGRPIRQFDFPAFQYQWVRWTPDGRHLSFIGTPPDPSNIWLQPTDGGDPRKLTDFKTDYIYRHAWSRDGKTLTLSRGRPTFDVVLLKDEGNRTAGN
jgi:eukaryotic-like serine/threonine-protein kinase